MANLVRLKQLDQPELSGFILDVTDQSYYPSNNPSGYISELSSDSDFIVLSGNLTNTGSSLVSLIQSTQTSLSGFVVSTGTFLNSRIDSVAADLVTTNLDVYTVSGDVQSTINSFSGFKLEVSGSISGEVSGLNISINQASGVLNTKINNVSGNLNSRITNLEDNFALTGSNFVDLDSNNQIIEGSKTFNNKIGFKQIDILPFNGNYSNPGGQHGILFTQFIDNFAFTASGLGTITGDAFITKIMQPNNIECIISSIIYTGSY
jgi:hypothetical protein